MPKYVISTFNEFTGITQEVVTAANKQEAFLTYFKDDPYLQDGDAFLDVEVLLERLGYELGYNISIIKVKKNSKCPWPFEKPGTSV